MHSQEEMSSLALGRFRGVDVGELTERCFSRRVLRSKLPVLVVVWFNGTGAEQGFLRLLEEWAPQARGWLRILRLDAERWSGLAERVGIPLAPGLALFSQGAMCYQFVGQASRRELDEVLARVRALGMIGERRGASGEDSVEPLERGDG